MSGGTFTMTGGKITGNTGSGGGAVSYTHLDVYKRQGLDTSALYEVESLPPLMRISDFGALIKHALPVKLRHDGAVMRTADRLAGLRQSAEKYRASGAALMDGIRLGSLFLGTGYDKALRLPGDFGSEIYLDVYKRQGSR